ncbi:MAG: glycosyltransferase family 2 protein [Planctomycetia bacterium]|nr:glycosyltransferase family 2 protein [Planctomycetia bacterium]
MPHHPQLSVVLPCYNEAPGLEALLTRFEQHAGDTSFELILVDNGSTDDTAQRLPRLLARFPFARTVRVEKNQGYGHGILTGLRAAVGEVLAWSHADLQTDPADVFKAWKIYQASETPRRTMVKGRRYGRRLQERLLSWGMQLTAGVLLQAPLSEINAQPKMFHRELLDCLSDPPIDLNFDVYVLYAAYCCGWRTTSFQVAFPPRTHGQSSWATSWQSKFRTIRRSFGYLWKLAWETPPQSVRSPAAGRSRATRSDAA